MKTCTRCAETKPEHDFGPYGQCKACKRLYDRFRNYGVSEAWYEATFQQQGGGCAICGDVGGLGFLVVDHCHDTEHNRGLLCSRCNIGIGQFGDDPDRVRSAYEYLIHFARKIVSSDSDTPCVPEQPVFGQDLVSA